MYTMDKLMKEIDGFKLPTLGMESIEILSNSKRADCLESILKERRSEKEK